MKDREYLISQSPWKALVAFSLPMMLGNLFQQLYTMTDSVIVGRYVGEDALAAVGASYSLTSVFIAVAIGGGVGGGVLVSRAFGSRDYDDMKEDARVGSLFEDRRNATSNLPCYLTDVESGRVNDYASRHLTEAEIRKLRDEGRTVIVSFHDISRALSVADDIIVLSGGSLAAFQSRDAFLSERTAEKLFGLSRAQYIGEDGREGIIFIE